MQRMLPSSSILHKPLHRPRISIRTLRRATTPKRCAGNKTREAPVVLQETTPKSKEGNGKLLDESNFLKSIAGDSAPREIRSKISRYSPERLVLAKFSKPVQQIWTLYKSNPDKYFKLRELCKGSPEMIQEVARLGKLMSAADDPEIYRCAGRLLFSAEHAGSRLAALFIVNMALRVGTSMHHVRVAKAIDRVFAMADQPGDLAALTLKSRVLQNRGDLHGAFLTFSQAYQALKTFVPEKPEIEVVGGSDLLYAFAMFKINSDDPEEYYEAMNMLKEAGLEGGHMAACLQLEGKLEPVGAATRPEFEMRSKLHHQLLLKLAVSGHHAAAHALGMLYALPEEEFELLDPELQLEIKDTSKVSLKVSVPLVFRRMVLALSTPNQESGIFARLKTKFDALRLIVLHSTDSQPRSLSRSLEMKYHQAVTTYGNERYYKALDWFHFGRAVYFHPAMLEGARLAEKLGLPFETSFFYESARNIPEKERQRPYEEGLLEKEFYESARQPFLNDGRLVYESDHQKDVDMIQRIRQSSKP